MDELVGIIGAGPAGISAAVQLARYGISTVIYEFRKIGGLIENAYRVDNTMLFPSGLRGEEFVEIMREYARKYSLNVVKKEIKNVKKEKNFVVEPMGREHKYLVVATGTRPRKLPFKNVHYHISEIRGREYERVMIIGGGDIAFDYALSASEIAEEVILLHRSEIKAIPSLVDDVKKRKNVKIVRGEIVSIDDSVRTTAGAWEVDRVLGAIGRIPNIEIVSGIHSERMFLVGDVKNGIYRQTSLAIADGIKAGMKIWRCENGYTC